MKFFPSLGFEENPFEYTNADLENRLPDYFIPPPYFASVCGNPKKPQSFIVYAPRGGGKSAQRRMLEQWCIDNDILAITYDQFDFPTIKAATEVRIRHHLHKILRSIVVALLIDMKSEIALKNVWTKEERDIFTRLAAQHLDGITSTEFERILTSLRSLKEKFKSFWNEWQPAIELGIRTVNAALKAKVDIGDIGELSTYKTKEFEPSDTLKYQLELTVRLANKLGWQSIYILIDRVDESELTGSSPKDSFALIEPLVKDLQLLEMPGIAFKFFLWDLLQPFCKNVVRTDRVKEETLDWDREMLLQLWQKRLETFSNGSIRSLSRVAEKTTPYSVDELAYIFANHSPRDMVRIGNQIFAEQMEINPASSVVAESAIYKAIEKFCSQRTAEIIKQEKVIRDFKKIRQVDFTIPYLASQVFKETQNSTRSRMMIWRAEAAIIEVERIVENHSRQKRSVKLFAIKDIRVAKEMFPTLRIPDFLQNKYRRCPQCDASILRDWEDYDSSTICHDCQFDLKDTEANAQDTWRYRNLAYSRRRQYRDEAVEAEQLRLFDSLPDTLD